MRRWFSSRVRVTLINGADGQTLEIVKRRVMDLPERFHRRSTLELGGESWRVVKAVPQSREDFARGRTLELHLCREHGFAPARVLFPEPTICDAIPPLCGQAADGSELTLREDDWRQFEW
ncbi:MAG: hypothetical protein KDB61_04190, partial [Planctomycetes bacterium]|nr:hypothetical protein [Planctomycetota bacterium]